MSLAGMPIKSIDASSADGAGAAFEARGKTYFTAVVEASTGPCSVKLEGTISTSTHWYNLTSVTTFTSNGGLLATTTPYAVTDVRAVSSTVDTTGGITVWVNGA
jgi:hypothetical protein